MGRSVNDGTPAYAQIEFLERRNAELEAENERLRKALNGRDKDGKLLPSKPFAADAAMEESK